MIEKLSRRLDVLFQLLEELGAYQLERQSEVTAQAKTDTSIKEAWAANEVFSEVDLTTERRLLRFCREEYGDHPVISEEFNAQSQPPADAEYTIVVDPLDGTKPYLEGKEGFAISFGVMRRGCFVFAANYYPALRTLYYAFADRDGVFDRYHQPIPKPRNWSRECYLSLGFYDLLRADCRTPEKIYAALGGEVGDYPRSATYIFKRMLEGTSIAYLSRNPLIWDIGPSSLLLAKVGCSFVDLQGKPVDFSALANPPFRHPAVIALPSAERASFLEKLAGILEQETSAAR
jgi:fructose-1,6-bisphosphatase/inositol monophosphatase family enzyme